MNRRLRLLLVLAGLVSILAAPAAALAHPLGNFTINRYARIEPVGDRLRMFYVLDMAEIPAFQEQPSIDTNRDDQLSEDEKGAYASARTAELLRNISLRVDGSPVDLQPISKSLTFPPGQGGLSILRLEVTFEAQVAPGHVASVQYVDHNFDGRIGWKEVVVRSGAGASVLESDAPAADQSDALRSYPTDMLSSPLDRTAATFRIRSGSASQVTAPTMLGSTVLGRAVEGFPALPQLPELTLGAVLLALVLAAFWGALHALSPGHGKTIVAAYLVGSRGTPRHAAFLGLTVTATHTLGVYALGLLTLYASQYVLPETLYPWLGVASGLVVVGMGVFLLQQRFRGLLRRRSQSHQHDLARREGKGALLGDWLGALGARRPVLAAAGSTTVGGEAVGYGFPGTVEVAHVHASGTHHHSHHDHPTLAREHTHAVGEVDHQHHDHADDHEHGPNGHSHLPPGADGAPVTWRSLLALGVSGGLLPCPSALVVMLGAIAVGRVAFGLLLVLAFSAGLAAVLIGFGLLLLYAGRVFRRVPTDNRLFRLIPVGSAAVILVAGLAVTFEGLAQTGLLVR